jgi:hypothetical protein
LKAGVKTLRDAPIEKIWGREKPLNCEICGGRNNNRPLCADHDHATGQPRLFLCTRCNALEGFIKKDWKRLEALIAYHLWCDGFRGTFNISIGIKADYPRSPLASAADVAWIRRIFERSTKRYPKK